MIWAIELVGTPNSESIANVTSRRPLRSDAKVMSLTFPIGNPFIITLLEGARPSTRGRNRRNSSSYARKSRSLLNNLNPRKRW